jgi:hypothetical protein
MRSRARPELDGTGSRAAFSEALNDVRFASGLTRLSRSLLTE